MSVHMRGMAGIGRHSVEPTGGGEDWRSRAACRDTDPEAFFVLGDSAEHCAPAIRVCNGCSVREECLKFALEYGEVFGVWGGTTARARRKLRKQHGIVARPRRLCLWCSSAMPAGVPYTQGYCSDRCRDAGNHARSDVRRANGKRS